MAEKIQWHPGFYAGMELELKAFDLPAGFGLRFFRWSSAEEK